MSFLFWLPFVVVIVFFTLRMHQAGGRLDPAGYLWLGAAAALAVTTFFVVGWVHSLLMAASGGVLFLLGRPLAAQLLPTSSRSSRSRPSTPAEVRAERLKRGDISVAEFREQAGKEGRVEQDRLTDLSRQPEIAALLRRHRISFRQLCLLREKLSLIPEFEWAVLGSPPLLEELIELDETGKGRQEIARHFRAKAMP